MGHAKQMRRMAREIDAQTRRLPHVALALAAAAQYLGWQDEPLTPPGLADGEPRNSAAWEAESARLLAERDEIRKPSRITRNVSLQRHWPLPKWLADR